MKPLLISRCLLGEKCRYDGRSKPLQAEALQALSERFVLIPVCPEELGGLPTPRNPSERRGDRVVMADGTDVTEAFRLGASRARTLAAAGGAAAALLKEKSPSCGKGKIYDGSFTGTLIEGNGVTAEALLGAGLAVYGESEIEDLLSEELGVQSEE